MENSVLKVTVSQVNNYIKNIFDTNAKLTDICVSGELSNVKCHFSGHIYMTLKDEKSSMRAVMFKGDTFSLRFKPEDGMKVLARGRISVYERDGQYQLYARSIEPDGVGALFKAYEQLKAKLESEGYFDPAKKKPIPKFPKTVGVVTAKTGAALRDILNILKRRYPLAEVRIFPVLVQGELARYEIAKAIDYINEKNLCDVIITGRGGGSIEDLWAFNEEIVAKSVFNSKIPVISSVGHETDFTICDFVADMRAPTPSAAAELAVPDIGELYKRIEFLNKSLSSKLIYSVEKQKARLKVLSRYFEKDKMLSYIDEKRMMLDDQVSDLKGAITDLIKEKRIFLENKITRLSAQNPLNLLSKGYSVAKSGDKILKYKKDVASGDTVTITLSDGDVTCVAK